ncbi:MAG: PDZ domain-containing protein [Kiritimatiellae bacterium]|nr:PDZ domain-containing protein [Kiritimatiellia bacterium]
MTAPGAAAEIKIIRNNKEILLPITVGSQTPGPAGERAGRIASEKLGLAVENLTEEFSRRSGFEPGSGVIVSSVRPDSPAHRMGIVPGDVICGVNREPVVSTDDFNAALEKSAESGLVLLLVKDREESRFIAVRLE